MIVPLRAEKCCLGSAIGNQDEKRSRELLGYTSTVSSSTLRILSIGGKFRIEGDSGTSNGPQGSFETEFLVDERLLMIRGGLQFHRVPQYAIQPSTSGSTAMSIRHAWNDILSAQGDWPEEARYEGNTGDALLYRHGPPRGGQWRTFGERDNLETLGRRLEAAARDKY
ncbi:hypothetical protein HPB51_023346 [Rhipicephalus microplus]|uniref:Uncharacterized protein n=1 Tax=Rhipicephalus microplus TaxID=6941 RepID=A0A9J6EIV5_RHIMP|nr:hypothetical protein HPB51_023346 [Rhipicephalus microplus]